MEAVSSQLKASLVARAGRAGVRQLREAELARYLLRDPEIAVRHGEIVAEIPFSDRSLDSLRHELLNLAASGFRLENPGLENHLVAKGMADLVARLGRGAGAAADEPSVGDADVEAQFLRAAAELRDLAEIEPERQRAAERLRAEPTEASWAEYSRLKGASGD
jgi:hypothetical protein